VGTGPGFEWTRLSRLLGWWGRCWGEERGGGRWGGGDVVIDQLWDRDWSDIVDEGEGR